MRYASTTVLLGLSFGIASIAAGAQAVAPTPAPVTPRACLTAYNADINASIAEAVKAQQPFDGPAIVAHASANAKQCATQFDIEHIDTSELSDLGALYLVASQLDLADRAFRRTFSDPRLPDSLRAAHMAQAARAYLGFRSHDAAEVATSRATAARYVAELDSVPGALVQRFLVRATLLGYYDEHDVDSGIAKVAPEMIALARQMTPAQLLDNADHLMSAYVTWSEVWANELQNDTALRIVQRADQEFPVLATTKGFARDRLTATIARYEMVGKPAPAIRADFWPNGQAQVVNAGATLVMFSAHDCPACRLSYPTMAKIDSEFAPRGFHLVLDVDMDGEFDNKTLSPEQEVAANQAYYRQLHSTCPIAFERPGQTDKDGNERPGPNANSVRYHTTGWPYYYVIDRHGIVRAVLVGWDTSGVSERSLRTIIDQLLKST